MSHFLRSHTWWTVRVEKTMGDTTRVYERCTRGTCIATRSRQVAGHWELEDLRPFVTESETYGWHGSYS